MSYSTYTINNRVTFLQSEIDNIQQDLGNYVPINGDTTINDIKTFSGTAIFNNLIGGSINGNSATSTVSDLTLSAPDSSLSSNVVLKDGSNIMTGNSTFNNIITGSITGNSATSTVSNLTLSAPDTSLSSNVVLKDGSNVYTGSNIFNTIPTCPIVPSTPNDLINLSYFNANNPNTGVIVYLNNSLLPSPPINSYALLGIDDDGLPTSNIPVSLSGVGTIQLIKGFANYLPTLSIGAFIPAGIFDLNLFCSANSASDTTHINIYFALYGRNSGGSETQLGSNSSSVNVDTITVQQLKMSLALPYTDMSPYTSFIVKLFAINNRSASTSITTFFEGTNTYSHMHTPLSVYVPPNILSLNNIFTGTNQFDLPIVGSITGNSATSTTSNTTLSAPDSSLSANVPLKNSVNIFSANNTFNNPITGSITGNSSTSTTSNSTLSAPDSSLSTNVPLKNSVNIFSANNTFNNIISGSINGNSATSTTSNTTLSAPDSSLSANVPLKNSVNIFSANNTFNNPITGSITGNSATSTTSNITLSAPDSSLSTNVPLKNSVNIFSANNTFNNIISGSINGNSATSTTASVSTSSTLTAGGSGTMSVILSNGTGGNYPLLTNIPTYTTSTATLNCNVFNGALTGNATTSTTSNTTLSAPDSSLSTNVPLKNTTNTFSAINTFSSPPVMSGASISSNSIPDGALTSNVPLKNATNVFSGNNTFNTIITGNITGNSGTASGVATTINNIANATYTIPFVSGVIGSAGQTVYVGVNSPTLNPSTGVITATSDITTTGNFNGNSATFTGILSSSIYRNVIQTPANGQTISFGLGSLLVDNGITAIAWTLPILGATSNGWCFTVQKTSATNHNLDINAGAGNQMASLTNVLSASFRLTNGIYTQDFRFINPNWYPY